MAKATVLIVEDDRKIRTLLSNVLREDGFQTTEAESAVQALDILQSTPLDLITLDIHLGNDSGFDLARDIRKSSGVPIIIVTGKDDVIDRVVGLEIGADDYITKPFHVREVLARVKSVLRRSRGAAPPVYVPAGPKDEPEHAQSNRFVFDGIVVAPDELSVKDREGEDLALTSGDLKLLVVFLQRPKRVLSRDQLMDLTGGLEWSPLDRTIDNQVARLRKKIERDPSDPQLIKTVRGIGYSFACDVSMRHDTDPKSA